MATLAIGVLLTPKMAHERGLTLLEKENERIVYALPVGAKMHYYVVEKYFLATMTVDHRVAQFALQQKPQ
jgi:hypothetical protein